MERGRLNPEAGTDWAGQKDINQLRELIGQIQRGEFPAVPQASPKKGWFDFTINVQLAVAGVVALVCAMAGWGFNTILSYQQFQTTISEFRTTTQAQLTAQASSITSLSEQLNTMRQGNIQLRDQLAKWQADSQSQNVEQNKTLSTMDKNLAVIQERMNELRAPGPTHGAVEAPEKFGSLEQPLPLFAGRGEVPHLGGAVHTFAGDHP